jgi:hypothetical protein
VLDLAFEELVEASELEHAGGLAEEVGGLYRVDPVEHGVEVDGELLEDGAEEVVGDIGLAEGVVVDDGVLPAETGPR